MFVTTHNHGNIEGLGEAGLMPRVPFAYRHGLMNEKEKILNFLGEDFLALEELKMAFPERYRQRMADKSH